MTPFELELALTSKSWTGDYVLDFTTLLSSPSFGQDYVDPDKSEDEEDGPVFSSAKGSYRHPKKYDKGVVVGAFFWPFFFTVFDLAVRVTDVGE